MFRFILCCLFLLFSLVNFFPVPSKEIWYLGILFTEFPWVGMGVSLLLLLWSCKGSKRLKEWAIVISTVAFFFYSYPVAGAYFIGQKLDDHLEKAYGVKTADLSGFHQAKPFSFWQMFFGSGAKPVAFKTYPYTVNGGQPLSLNFYPSQVKGVRPCLMVIHGGSWKRGDNSEIAKVNEYFANAGYQVATINYRLAPKYHSPATQEDAHSAFVWLRKNAVKLQIDTNNFALLGRSAGGQIVLTSAFVNTEPGLRGVVAFYGPNDMFWSYEHPDNPLIMDSKMVQRDFLGGAPDEIPETYKRESPYLFVTPKTLPTLQVHGQVDAHVHYEQSLRLAKKLDKMGVPNFLLTLPWGTHGCEYNLNGPSGQLSMYSVERFLFAVTQKHSVK